MSEKAETATCRGCGIMLIGKPYYMGGSARHPRTGELVKVNFYGGYVCSRQCDFNSSLRLESTMRGHNYDQKTLGCFALEAFKKNWS